MNRKNYPTPRSFLRPLFLGDIDRVFEDLWGTAPATYSGGEKSSQSWSNFTPTLDLFETEREVKLVAELPGIEEKDVELKITDKELVLKGQKREHFEGDRDGWHHRESFSGSFMRSVALDRFNVDSDNASAELKQGRLVVTLPKLSARNGQKEIPIKSSQVVLAEKRDNADQLQ